MNWLDIAILVVVAFFVIKGMTNGVVREIANLGGTVLGVVVAYYRSGMLALWFTSQTGIAIEITRIVSFIALAFLIATLFSLLGAITSNALRATPMRAIDVVGGLLLGGLKAFFVISVVLVIIVALPVENTFAVIDDSLLADSFLSRVPFLYNVLATVFREQLPEGWVPMPHFGPEV